MDYKYIYRTVAVAVFLNVFLSSALKPFASNNQIRPPNGADNLSFFDQLMHMFVHHAQVLLTSSIIIAVVVGLSMYLAKLM
jgi:hypothetical protein